MERRRIRWQTAVVAAIAAALGAAGLVASCGGDDPVEVATLGEGCLINTDCASPLVCAFRRCHAECKANRDCPAGQRCMRADRPFRICQLDDEKKCAYNSECPEAQVCAIDGQCRDQCQADRDCVPEQVCATGSCASPEELVDGGLVPTNNQQTTGQPCSYTSECPKGLVCREGLCNYECFEDVDCEAFGKCNADRRCVYPDAGVVYCTPGSQIVCGCVLDGGALGNGQQICSDDGSKYGPCTGCM